MRTTVTFHRGQAVVYPDSPDGLGQVDELRRTCVGLLYRGVRGGVCRASVRAAVLARIQRFHPVLPGVGGVADNYLGRGVVTPARKTFDVEL